MNTQTQQTQKPQQAAYMPRPSPVGDLIRKHRELMRLVWQRHADELQHPQKARTA